MFSKIFILMLLSLPAFAERTGPAIRNARAEVVLYKFHEHNHDDLCKISGEVPVFDWRESPDVTNDVLGTCQSTLGGQAVDVQVSGEVLIVTKSNGKTYKEFLLSVTVVKAGTTERLQAYSAYSGTLRLDEKDMLVSVNPNAYEDQEIFHAVGTLED